MSYSELLHRLFRVNLHSGMKLGLDNCIRLQKLLNFPDRAFQSIHVAGTNGKGSVVLKIAYGLQRAGHRVGVYTSPHLSSFRERIRINGEMISEDAVEELLSFLFQLVESEDIPATFFELTTFLAFLYFAHQKVDVAVLETGLGGRLDATNIVKPILSVITSISLDHTETLGNTREAIAKEKGGIIKPNTSVIIGPKVPLKPISEIAHCLNSPFHQVKEFQRTFDEENRSIAKGAFELLASKFSLSQEAINQGLNRSQPCRFEVVPASFPPIILDVAHNPDGLLHLFKAIDEKYPDFSLRIFFGLSKTKDIPSCLKIIRQHSQDYHLVEAPNGRGAPTETLVEGLLQLGVESEQILVSENISTSVVLAVEKAKQNQQILVVCGSFFIMSSVRKALGYQETVDEIDMNERLFQAVS